MLTEVHPKLPMRDKAITENFYVKQLGFALFGDSGFPDYLMLQKDGVQLHFFRFRELEPAENYGQVYIRTDDIEALYADYSDKKVIHPNGALSIKPWGLKEFSVLDPDKNLLTFGQAL